MPVMSAFFMRQAIRYHARTAAVLKKSPPGIAGAPSDVYVFSKREAIGAGSLSARRIRTNALSRLGRTTRRDSRQQFCLEPLQHALSSQVFHRVSSRRDTECVAHLRIVGQRAHRMEERRIVQRR